MTLPSLDKKPRMEFGLQRTGIGMRSTNMDPLLPKLRIYNTSIPADRHQCTLRCTKAAIVYQKENPAGSNKTPKPTDVRLWNEETALEEAKGRVMATGVPSPTEEQYLGQLIVTFGKYCHCSFKWLLENDVGYVKYLVDKHLKERGTAKPGTQLRDGWLKDYLVLYTDLFPPVSTQLDKNIDMCVYGQSGFQSRTFLEMWNLFHKYKSVYKLNPEAASPDVVEYAQKAYASVRSWLVLKLNYISSGTMKRFRQYILDKEQTVLSTPETFSPTKRQLGATASQPTHPSRLPTATASRPTHPSRPPTYVPRSLTDHPSRDEPQPSLDDTTIPGQETQDGTQTSKNRDRHEVLSTSEPFSPTKHDPSWADDSHLLNIVLPDEISAAPRISHQLGATASRPTHPSRLPTATASRPTHPSRPPTDVPRSLTDHPSRDEPQPSLDDTPIPGQETQDGTRTSKNRDRLEVLSTPETFSPTKRQLGATASRPTHPSRLPTATASRPTHPSRLPTATASRPTHPFRPPTATASRPTHPSRPPTATASRPTHPSRLPTATASRPTHPSRPPTDVPRSLTDHPSRDEPQPSLDDTPIPGQETQDGTRTSKNRDRHEIVLEGWSKTWESEPGAIPAADRTWLKDDLERGLFGPVQTYKDVGGEYRQRRVLKTDRMWFYPPDCPGFVGATPPSADLFFRSKVFFWRPVGIWGYSIRCPRENCPGRESKDVFLYRNGYHGTGRQICDSSGWYTMLTELLACGPCNKLAKNTEYKRGVFLAWDNAILSQLTEAHQALFPAVLTLMRGVDKQVIQLMRDRTQGNTMTKVWRQIQENHCEVYLNRKDLYTTLLDSLNKPGGIILALGHRFKPPPKRRELPSPKLLRLAFMMSEANNIQDYRTQIMSTFGRVLKFDSTKKICKKLSGPSRGTAEWCTNVGNELSQILSCVLTCEESVAKLSPMAKGLMNRYERAGEPAPDLMYVDRGCCRQHGATAVQVLFDRWVAAGMVVRLDAWHWMHRFDAAVRTDSHPKYALFKSALSGAVFAYNRADVDLLVRSERAATPTKYSSLTDDEVLKIYISRDVLKHHVRRITVGAQETFRLVSNTIKQLKGPDGQDENGIALFKSPEAIDEVWAGQQKHLECIQDPPGMPMYSVVKRTSRNGTDVPYYCCIRGNNSLEGFHLHLPRMIPGDHCAAKPFQLYLLSGLARWNADREAASVFGRKGRRNRIYSSSLIHRLNQRSKALFGEDEVEEINYRPPVPAGDELIGLEYLFKQSSAVEEPIDYSNNTDLLVEDDSPEVQDDAGADDGYTSDGQAAEDDAVAVVRPKEPIHLTLTDDDTATALDPSCEDVCGPNPLPGYANLEKLCQILVQIANDDSKLSIGPETRDKVINAWHKLADHDRNPQNFRSAYQSRWGNTMYGRTKGDAAEAAVTQKIKFNLRYTPAQLIDAKKNRLVYCLIKHLWLATPKQYTKVSSPDKARIQKLYERMQHRILVEDPILSKLGMPLPKINTRCIRDFLRRQEALASSRSTSQGSSLVTRMKSFSSSHLPDAPVRPSELLQTDRPEQDFDEIECRAGQKITKKRSDSRVREDTQAVAGTSSSPSPASSTQPSSTFISPARSTLYKRKKHEDTSPVPMKCSKVTIPKCVLCGQPTQGHKKYKKKTWCDNAKQSTSKGLSGRIFRDFDHFTSEVDALFM